MSMPFNIRERDPWQGLIAQWINGRSHVTIGEVLGVCLGKLPETRTQADSNRVARSLKSLKWERYQQRVGKKTREWRYRRVPSPEEIDW
jgi:hypothetical protein